MCLTYTRTGKSAEEISLIKRFSCLHSEHELMLTRSLIQSPLTFVRHNYGLMIALRIVILASPWGNSIACAESDHTVAVRQEGRPSFLLKGS